MAVLQEAELGVGNDGAVADFFQPQRTDKS